MTVWGRSCKVRNALAAILLGVTVALAATAPAGAAGPPWLYWSNIDKAQPLSVSRSDLNGNSRTPNFITTPWNPYGLFVNSSSIYWGQYAGSGIARANVDGSGQDKFFITGADSPTDITSDDSYIYWANNGNGTVGRANLDGSGVTQSFIGGISGIYSVWATNDYLYWSTGASGNGRSAIGRASLPSGQVDDDFGISGPAVRQPATVVTDENYVYWTNSAGAATIGRAELDGSSVNGSFITAGPLGSRPYGLAISGQYLYWTLYATNDIGRAETGGTGVDTNFITNPSNKSDGPGSLALSEYMLSVNLSGSGSGTVTSEPGGISCPGDCAEEFPQGQMVTLTAAAGDSSQFAGWSGACSGSGPTCTVTMSQSQSVTASFGTLPPASYQLSVGTTGTGAGTVSSSPSGISCPTDCVQAFTQGTAVTLTPTPSDGSQFAGWGGACSGTGPCTVTMDRAASVTATFDALPPSSFRLTVNPVGTGLGSVTSAPAGIDCPGDCSQGFASGTLVTLTATPADGSSFSGWGGSCSGTGPCVVTMSQARTVTASFTTLPPASFDLSVTGSGSGSGTVTSEPPGIDCGPDCTQGFIAGTTVTLTATPSDSSAFAGWSGACSGTSSTCTVTMSQARSVTATFATLPPSGSTLTVSADGTGSGIVTSSPPGINCGADCRQGFPQGTTVTLTASPDDQSQFAGWGGACSGTSETCTVAMSQARSVTATFNTLPAGAFLLTVEATDSGYGTVTSSPAGIRCGADCRQNFPAGSTVTLRRSSLPDGSFGGWSGACSGSGSTCTVKMSQPQTVVAAFEPNNDFSIRWIRPGARLVRERISVPGAGRVTLRGTRKASNGLPVTACRGLSSLRRAGSFTVACTLTSATARAAQRRPVRIRVATTFDPAASGALRTRYRWVRVGRPHFTG